MDQNNNRHYRWLHTIAYIIIIYACIPNRLFAEIRYCMDPSWQYAINTAIQKHYVFGNDFVFTYGPLGFLSTALPLYLADHGLGIVLYKTILFAALSAIGIYAVRSAVTIWQKAAVVLVFVLAGRLYSYESSVYYMMLFLALLLWHQKKQKDGLLYIALVYACINFYIKLNTGLVLLVLLVLYLAALVFRRQLSGLRLLGMTIGGAVLIGLIAWLTNTNLPFYTSNGFEIVKHFSSAESNPVSTGSATFLSAMAMLLGFAYLLIGYLKTQGKKKFTWINSIMMAGCLFVAFKQGFVRGSHHHQVSFFASSLVLLLIFFVLANGWEATLVQHVAGLAILVFATISIVQIGIYGFGFSPLKDLYTNNDNRIAYLPERIKTMIGPSTVDILPFEAMHLYYNELNYAPRPVPQGYQAYSKKLDSINAAYYQRRAPVWVLLANGSIDNRHPFWDEYQTKRAIRSNYTVADSLLLPDRPGQEPTKYWLLKRKEFTTRIRPAIMKKDWQQAITDTIDCSAYGQDDLLQVRIAPNTLGRIRAFLFQPAILSCHIQYASGAVSEYDAITPILAAGIPVGYRLEEDEDIAAFLRHQPSPVANKIQKIWFTGSTALFGKTIGLQLLKEQMN